jgi:hypothetical protein
LQRVINEQIIFIEVVSGLDLSQSFSRAEAPCRFLDQFIVISNIMEDLNSLELFLPDRI